MCPTPTTGARAVPIYQTTSYVFDSPDQAAQLFELKQYGNIYTRISNPTTAVLEERLASLEGATGALVVASGMAAQFVTLMTLLSPGDEIVASSHLYGGTVTQFKQTLQKLSLKVTLCRSARFRGVGSGDHAEDARALRRDDRQSARLDPRPGEIRRPGRRAQDPAHHRQHLRHALPLPPDGIGRDDRRSTRRRSSSAATATPSRARSSTRAISISAASPPSPPRRPPITTCASSTRSATTAS